MDLENCKKIGQLLVENFAGKVEVFLFGSTARFLKSEKELDSFEKAFRSSDLDFFLEVDPKVFDRYCQECHNQGLHFDGEPHDTLSMYWDYHSSVATRMNVVMDILGVVPGERGDLIEALQKSLQGNKFDVLVLPFNWKENEEILEVINSKDPKFSKNVEKDATLLLKKEA